MLFERLDGMNTVCVNKLVPSVLRCNVLFFVFQVCLLVLLSSQQLPVPVELEGLVSSIVIITDIDHDGLGRMPLRYQ